MRYTNEDLIYLQSKTLDEKIGHCLDMAQIFYVKMQGRAYISFSGGLDSTVLRDVLNVEYKKRGGTLWEKIPSVYCDTGLEYPEIKSFVKTFGDVEIIRPEMNFVETIRTFGYPLIRREWDLQFVQASIQGMRRNLYVRRRRRRSLGMGGAEWLNENPPKKFSETILFRNLPTF